MHVHFVVPVFAGMASPNRHPGTPHRCAQAISPSSSPSSSLSLSPSPSAIALDPGQDDEQGMFKCAEPLLDYDFVEEPSEDFFCPVMTELLMEPQQTSCCGHHLSVEASARLQREGKVCPMCNEQQWTAALDKYHRRRVREIRVRCPHKRRGCDWEGEVGGFERHAASCPKQPWECPHCALRCTYGEGEGKHWPSCSKFPEPCPNGCEVGSVERRHLEQHRRECPLEPVACEMREFGCSAVVPRKDLATHMRESELQHLTAMAVLNLRLTRQLQQDAAEKDEKIAQLQMEVNKQNEEISKLVVKSDAGMKKELADLKQGVEKLSTTAQHIALHAAAGLCELTKVFTFNNYTEGKKKSLRMLSDAFYTHECGYKLKLRIKYYSKPDNDIGVSICWEKGEYDDQLPWPVKVKIHLELLNQAWDHHHVERRESWQWSKEDRQYPDLERRGFGVQYMRNNCLKFRLHLTVQAV